MYLELMKDGPPLTSRDKEDIARVTRALHWFDQAEVGIIHAISPIIFGLDRGAPFSQLLSSASVRFDVDGFGDNRLWSWVSPTTGLLVWDPGRTGRVRSGHQLIGVVSFHSLWRDGYDVLDALDDDRDGTLRGAELKGLAVWIDRNSNGVSDPGEVVDLDALGIVGLATHPTGNRDGVLRSDHGALLRDGSSLPTYDWISHSIPDQQTDPKGPPS